MFLRIGELRERRFRHHVGSRAPGWYAAVLSTLWTRRLARGGSGPQRSHRATRFALPDVADVGRLMQPGEWPIASVGNMFRLGEAA